MAQDVEVFTPTFLSASGPTRRSEGRAPGAALARAQVGGSIAAGTRGPQLVNFCFNRVGPSRNSGAGSLNWVTNIEDW